MLNWLFDLPTLGQVACFTVFGIALYGFSAGIIFYLQRKSVEMTQFLPHANAFQLLSILLALLIGFLGADIWAQQRNAGEAALKEGHSIARLQELEAGTPMGSPEAALAIKRYREAVADLEWGKYFNHQADPAASAALTALRLYGARLGSEGMPSVLVGEWMRAVNDLEEARDRRLFIGSDSSDNSQWVAVLVMTFFAGAALAVCHLDRPGGGRLILFLYSLAIAIVLLQMARHTNPYSGGGLQVSMSVSLGQPVGKAP